MSTLWNENLDPAYLFDPNIFGRSPDEVLLTQIHIPPYGLRDKSLDLFKELTRDMEIYATKKSY